MSTIRVLGLVSGQHTIEDIGVDVPYGATIDIAGDLAYRSTDLWRAISQKFLVQVTNTFAAPPVTDTGRAKRLETYVLELESQLARAHTKIVQLEAENQSLRSIQPKVKSDSDEKLEMILQAIQNGGLSQHASRDVSYTFEKYGSKPSDVDLSIPTFLPSEIIPKNVDAQISAQEEASSSTGVTGAAGKLRQIRKAKDNS